MDKDLNLNPYTANPFSSHYRNLLKQRKKLPVWRYKDEFIDALEYQRCILLEAETGSGKTTQVNKAGEGARKQMENHLI